MKIAGLFVTVLAIGFAISTNVLPLRVECPDEMSIETCHGSVAATLRRGLVVPHPLLLGAHVEPGPAGPSEDGHRATVTFDLLGMPFPTAIELHYDMGGHWGGVADHGWPELPLWWGVPVVILLGVGGLLVRRDRQIPPEPPGAPAGPTA